ncbi:MAG: hypothetical protein FJ403_23320 [Verrucomicrobia bacterium]|nr:hypothetical protein [Verrucomicrobiota bacterium]
MKTKNAVVCVLIAASICSVARGDDKVALGEPKDEKVQLDEPKSASVDKEMKDLPDGVLKVKTNPDGSFKSLVVKATVEIEDVLGAQKGKRLGRKEAEIQCKRLLSQWVNENCAFAETQSKITTIITKGESSKDAAGNKVTIRNQKAEEIKVNTEGYASASVAVFKGFIVLQSEVTNEKEYVLVMGLSQKTIEQANMVAGALSGNPVTPGEKASGAKSSPDKDSPNPEKKTNPDIDDFLK